MNFRHGLKIKIGRTLFTEKEIALTEHLAPSRLIVLYNNPQFFGHYRFLNLNISLTFSNDHA